MWQFTHSGLGCELCEYLANRLGSLVFFPPSIHRLVLIIWLVVCVIRSPLSLSFTIWWETGSPMQRFLSSVHGKEKPVFSNLFIWIFLGISSAFVKRNYSKNVVTSREICLSTTHKIVLLCGNAIYRHGWGDWGH